MVTDSRDLSTLDGYTERQYADNIASDLREIVLDLTRHADRCARIAESVPTLTMNAANAGTLVALAEIIEESVAGILRDLAVKCAALDRASVNYR